jgi:alkylated DNA repair protein alkB family protein 1
VSSLSRYTRPPNPLSLSTHYDLPPNLFELYQSQAPQLIRPLFDTLDAVDQETVRAVAKARVENPAYQAAGADVRRVEGNLARNKAWSGDMPAEGLEAKTAAQLMSDLRWANLGLVYKVCHHVSCAETSGRRSCTIWTLLQ